MTAKEYLLSIGIRTDEQDLLDVMESYATSREQDAFEAGYLARKRMQSSGNYKPLHEAYKYWKGDAK